MGIFIKGTSREIALEKVVEGWYHPTEIATKGYGRETSLKEKEHMNNFSQKEKWQGYGQVAIYQAKEELYMRTIQYTKVIFTKIIDMAKEKFNMQMAQYMKVTLRII